MATTFFLELGCMQVNDIAYRDKIHLEAEAGYNADLIKIDIDRSIGREATNVTGRYDTEAREKFRHGNGAEAVLFTPKQARLLARALLLAADDIDTSVDSKNE